MKKHHLSSLTLVTCLVSGLPLNALAQNEAAPPNSALYYDLGSGTVSVGALNPIGFTRFQALPGDTVLPSLCDIWEDRHSVASAFGDLVDFYLDQQLALEGLTEEIIAGVKTAPEVLLVAALQRALPGLYDFSQNLKAQIDFKIDNAELSCQKAVDKMETGTNPLDGWIQVSMGQAWRETLTEDYIGDPATPTHLLSAEQDVLENGRSKPIPWFGGPAGAEQDNPIVFVNDVVKAGFAAMVDVDASVEGGTWDGSDDPIAAPATTTVSRLNDTGTGIEDTEIASRLRDLWENSTQAVEFAREVLGEEEIATCETCTSRFAPGQGLSREYERQQVAVTQGWVDLVNDFDGLTTRPKLADYAKVSSRKVRMGNEVYDAIMQSQGIDRVILVEKLASDIAAERAVDRALALRQLLRSGSDTPEVRGNEFIAEKAKALIDRLRDEVDDLRWEIEQQNRGAGHTAARILSAAELGRFTRGGGSLGTGEAPTGGAIQGDRIVE